MSFEDLFERIRRRMKELFEEFEKELESTESMWTPDGMLEPLITIEKYPDRYEVIVDLPYADLRALSVKVRDHVMTIECELKREIRFDRWTAYREVRFRKYHTSIRLPRDSDPTNIRLERDEVRGIIRLIIPRLRPY